MRHLFSEQIYMKWKLIERKYALISITKKKLNVPEKPKLKCLGFTYNGAKLFNMLPLEMKKMEDPNIFKTKTNEWIWENITSVSKKPGHTIVLYHYCGLSRFF